MFRPGISLYIREINGSLIFHDSVHLYNSGRFSDFRIVLLLRLPNLKKVSGTMQVQSPVTAAGPSSICTKFPFNPSLLLVYRA